MRDALRGYLSVANGMAEVPRRRATAVAKALVAQGEATAEQVTQLTDELLATSRSNREALSNLIRYEVDRTLDQMGLVAADKFRALVARVATLEAESRSIATFPAGSGAPADVSKPPGRDATAAESPAKKAPAKKAPAKKAPAKKAPAKKAPAKKAVGGRS